MKTLIKVVFGIAMFFWMLTFESMNMPMVADARCLKESETEFWNCRRQLQKERVELLSDLVVSHQALLSDCNSDCIENYADASKGVLISIANKYSLPRDLVILGAIVDNWEWGIQATNALKRPLVQSDWDSHFYLGMNDFALRLQIEVPYVLVDAKSNRWCLRQFYNGSCAGKW